MAVLVEICISVKVKRECRSADVAVSRDEPVTREASRESREPLRRGD